MATEAARPWGGATIASAGAATCVICGGALPAFRDPNGPRVCNSLTCQWALRAIPADRLCRICRNPLETHQLAERVCAAPRCRSQWLLDQQRVHAEHRRKEMEAFLARASALRDAAADAMHVAEPQDYLLIEIPPFHRRVTRLPRARRAAFREYLTEVIAEAAERRATEGDAGPADAPPPEPMSTELTDVLGKGCAQCRGNCCATGRTHAYLRADRMLRYMRAHPTQSPEEVADAYLGYIGTDTFHDSCVYHGKRGCTLPREMRADICNSFYCEGLRNLQRQAPNDAPIRVFYASISGDDMHAAFVDRNEVRVVRRGLARHLRRADHAAEPSAPEHREAGRDREVD